MARVSGEGASTMWFYIFLLVLAVLFVVWCVTRTNLFRHWHAHNSHPGQQGTRRAIPRHFPRRDPDLEPGAAAIRADRSAKAQRRQSFPCRSCADGNPTSAHQRKAVCVKPLVGALVRRRSLHS